MQVSIENGMYKGSHTTGPTHNYLGVTFSTLKNHDFTIEILPPIGRCPQGLGLTCDEVRPWIEEGLRAAENEIGRKFTIERAEVIENDNRRPEVYRELARRIVLKHHEDQSNN